MSELELFANVRVRVRVIYKCQSQSYLQMSELELFTNIRVSQGYL
jgi:hypothetical protein